MGSDTPTGMSNDMESDAITAESCRASAKNASRSLENPAWVDNLLISNHLEYQGYRPSSTIESSDGHKSLANSVRLARADVELAGFIPNLQHGGMCLGPELLITADISTRTEYGPGKIAAGIEIASTGGGWPGCGSDICC